MATDDNTLKSEIRLLTDYDSTIISSSDLDELVALAKRELLADTGRTSIDWFSQLPAERALFWLTCIFCKVKLGEIDAPAFSIGELDVDTYDLDDQVGLWFDNFWKHYWAIGDGAPIGHTTSMRSNRTYGFDN